jgi:WD40 repeat protein
MTSHALLLGGLLWCGTTPSAIGGADAPLEPLLPTGHAGPVYKVRVSGDGKRALTTGYHAAILWDATTGKPLRSLQLVGMGGPAELVGADLKVMVTAADGKTPVLWDTATGKQLQSCSGATAAITGWCLSDDGKTLVTGHADGTVVAWDTATGKKRYTLKAHTSAVDTVALSGDGKVLVTWDTGNHGFAWNAEKGIKRTEFVTTGLRTVGTAQLNAKGTRLFTRDTSGKEGILWNVADLYKMRVFEGDLVRYSPNTGLVVTLTEIADITYWEAETGKKLRTMRGPEVPALMTFDNSGSWLATADPEHKMLVVRDTALGNRRLDLKLDYEPHGVALSPEGDVVAVWSGKTVHLIGLFSGKETQTLQSRASAQVAVRLSGNGRYLAALADGGPAVLWDLPTGKIAHSLAGHKKIGGLGGFSPDGKFLLTTGTEPLAIEWDTATGKELERLKGGENEWASAAVSADGSRVAVADHQKGTIGVLDTATGKQVIEFKAVEGGIYSPQLSGDGKLVLAMAFPGRVLLFETDTGKLLREFVPGTPAGSNCAALSRDGKTVAVGAAEFAIVYEAGTGKEVQSVKHAGYISRVCLTGDGKRLFTAAVLAEGSVVTLWDVAAGKPLKTFVGHTSLVNDLALSADGKRLWTAAADGTVRLWDAATGEQLCALVCLDDGADWLVVTPAGLYDGSDGGRAQMAWTRPGTAGRVDDEATRKTMRREGLLGRLLKGEQVR